MNIKKINDSFGAVVKDVDINQTSIGELKEIKLLLKEYGVLYFPRQSLYDQEIISLCKAIGNGQLGQSGAKINLTSKFGNINNMTNLYSEESLPLGYGGNHTDFWHSDQAFRDLPATNALLYCLIPADSGGSTSFVSTKLDKLSLADEELSILRTLKSIYQPAVYHDNAIVKEVYHDTIVCNAKGEEESLYISENTIRLENRYGEDFSYMLQPLLNKIISGGDNYSHNWRIGDLLLFDNLQLLHRREAFSGNRWLKAVKIHADGDIFTQIEASK
ncbi:TauD/TfdA dioxygenase family protein [Pseudoalteromonas maricaloris]|uniref:TauD/TfdA dioxygenase family protein n=1 Tax=Pseudoalteromonas maricaloris TaxID=184924 RepID=UPI003C260B9D